MMSYEKAVTYLDDHIGMGMDPGLDRIKGLLEMMGNPEHGYPIVHIAGTNGKTSVSRTSTLLCAAHGLTTGTFISPHLERVEERISINGEIASPEQFAQAVADVAAFADIYEERHGPSLTYFELTAAMAFAWFADQAVEAAVIEVGLGGRLDATNAATGDVAVLTGVGLEHTEYLGDTLEKIATEKLAILEDEKILVVGPVVSDVAKLARRTAAAKSATIHEYGKDFRVDEARRAIGGWNVDVEGVYGRYENLYLPVHGRHQTLNLATSLAAVESLVGRELDHEAVMDAVSVVAFPGRMEPVGTDPLVMLDGAHNPDGFAALSASLAEEFPTTDWVLVMGVMEDKDLELMLPPLAKRLKAVITTSVESDRAAEPAELAAKIRDLVDVRVESIEDQAKAVDRAREIAAANPPDSNRGVGSAVLVAGSLYLVGAVRSLLRGERAQRNER